MIGVTVSRFFSLVLFAFLYMRLPRVISPKKFFYAGFEVSFSRGNGAFGALFFFFIDFFFFI